MLVSSYSSLEGEQNTVVSYALPCKVYYDLGKTRDGKQPELNHHQEK